ncbi:fructokinase [Shewanella avicenniae]|uniref:Fructokinase n=1 Tax=Shewanella avicenniae TaxID=2814294 RepID=A0ABX7QNJ1_9GAMM|nr:fructokinase [Shewanella avicenniae]QSX32587.1 fructokinase [Shewanella avicenniae]
MIRLGIDLGGTKTEIVALAEDGTELYRHREPSAHDYPGTLTTIAQLVNMAEAELGEKCSLGVGIPGVVSPFTGLVKNGNSVWLHGHPLDKDLGELLDREVRVANDANCFAVSEAVDGAAAGKGFVLGLIIGTGCGAGIAVNGQVHTGGNGIAGEVGHTPLPWMEPEEFRSTKCFCGNYDCIENYISGTGFVRDFNERHPELQVETGQDITALIAENHAGAIATFERYLDRLARSLAQMINIMDPDVIVLGGGMSAVDAIYPELPARVASYVVGRESETPIVKNVHGGSSGVRGAAWLWPL